MQNTIELNGLTKTYGKARGVQNVTLSVPEGCVFGFLGPNGAGKTTTISMLINLTAPTSGTIRLFGKDAIKHGLKNRKRIGYLAGDMALDKGLTGWQQLSYIGNLRGHFDAPYVRELAKRLDSNLDRKIKTLSRGNRQKIGLIAALMHKPELLILDEPTSGLDPLVQAEFNKIILEHKAAGKTTFISSHVLSEVQELCDQIAIIREGNIVANASMEELSKTSAKHVTITTPTKPIPYVTGLRGVESPKAQGNTLRFTYTGDINALIKHFSLKPLTNLTIEEASLEDIFMKYYEGDNV